MVKVAGSEQNDLKTSSPLTSSQLHLEEDVESGLTDNQDINEQEQYIWRCTCGKTLEKFGFAFTQHISAGKKAGEEHKWQLIDRETGEVVANSHREAQTKGLLHKKKGSSPSKARGKGDKGKAEDERQSFKPYTAIVEKFVQYTGELDGRLLLLYEMTLPLYESQGYVPTVEEWIEDVITQFYKEHAEDFKFDQVLKKFVEGSKDGVN